jgi:BirA family biotin operon repressor/biotin-[acetyl-CoA-carboxylase] ligase
MINERERHLAESVVGTRFREVRWLDCVDSTNRVALDAAVEGAADGLVVVADEQTAGRGRLGRRWEARPGSSLLVSVLLRPALHPPERPLLGLAAALASVEAVAEASGVVAQLKWPNDIVVGDRKLAGMLAETTGDAVVVGLGCNVSWGRLPEPIAQTATSLDLEGAEVSTGDLLIAWLRALDARVDALERGGAAALVADASDRMATLARRVRVERRHDAIVGHAQRLDECGRLVVRTDDGAVHEIDTGDVVHLRDA